MSPCHAGCKAEEIDAPVGTPLELGVEAIALGIVDHDRATLDHVLNTANTKMFVCRGVSPREIYREVIARRQMLHIRTDSNSDFDVAIQAPFDAAVHAFA